MIPLEIYACQQLFQIIFDNRLSVRMTSWDFVFEGLDIDLIGVPYGRSVLVKLAFHALAQLKLRLSPGTIRFDKQHESKAHDNDQCDLLKIWLFHFCPPNMKTLLFRSSSAASSVNKKEGKSYAREYSRLLSKQYG
jgi:hypothetical protein